MKIIFLIMLAFVSTSLFPSENAKENNTTTNDIINFKTPSELIELFLSEKLTFIGRDLLPINDQNKSCIFENSTIIFVLNNCLNSRTETNVQEFYLISKSGGMYRFYNEIFIENKKPSNINRKEFDGTWTIELSPTSKITSTDIKTIKKYFDENDNLALKETCFIGQSFKAKDMNAKLSCLKDNAKITDQLKANIINFWKEPSENWYKMQAEMKKYYKEAKF